MAEFFEMGGYGSFIWSAYGSVGLVLVGIWLASKRFVSNTEAELSELSPRLNPQKSEEKDEA
jgi:heme exporter protein D